jgi:integrase
MTQLSKNLSITFRERIYDNQKQVGIYARIRFQRREKVFWTGFKCKKGSLNVSNGEVKNDRVLTNLISTMKDRIYNGYISLLDECKDINLSVLVGFAEIKEAQNNEEIPLLFECMDRFFKAEYVDSSHDIEQGTNKKNTYYISNLRAFFKSIDKEKISLSDVKPIHHKEILTFIQVDKKSGYNHAVRHVRTLKRVLEYAIDNEWITNNPFKNFKAKTVTKEVIYLNEKDIDKLEKITLNTPILDTTRDFFLFSCYTGLSYIELKNLSTQDIKTDDNGIKYIELKRKKSGEKCIIPLFDVALNLLEKYAKNQACISLNRCFPVPTNQSINRTLKEVGAMAEISVVPTFHVARKTCATYLYNKEVPTPIIKKILGHTNSNTTEKYYAKMQTETVINAISQNTKLRQISPN